MSKDTNWYQFPPVGRGRVWTQRRQGLGTALRLFNPSRTPAKILKWLAQAGPAFLFTKREKNADRQEKLQHITRLIRATTDFKDIDVNISEGTPGPHQKASAQICRSNEILAYAKISSTPATDALLKNECYALRTPLARNLRGAEIPEVVAYERLGDSTILVQSTPACSLQQKRPALERAESDLLLELIPKKPAIQKLDELPIGDRLAAQWPQSGSSDDRSTRLLRDTLDFLRLNTEEGVSTGPCHGDFAPWNMAYTNNGRLFLFDWEYFQESAPLLSDLLHRIYMPARLVERIDPAAALQRLYAVWENPETSHLPQACNIQQQDSHVYIGLYLLNQALRESESGHSVPSHLADTLRYLLIRNRFRDYRLRVLVSAYACEPQKGSEPGVGWNWAYQIAREHDVWVVTRANNQENIELHTEAQNTTNMHFEYIDLPKKLTFWKKGGRGVHLYYYLWQFIALRQARRLHHKVQFDIGHHVTFVNDWVWTFFSLMNLPYIWGPIGSNGHLPSRLLPDFRARLHHGVRRIMQSTFRWCDPLFWLSMARSSFIITTNETVSGQYPLAWFFPRKGRIEPAIGMEPPDMSKAAAHEQRNTLKVLFAGQFLSIKGAHLAIKAFHRFSADFPASRLIMVGKGPYERMLRNLVSELGLTSRVDFPGWLNRTDTLKHMADADIFLYPSLESAGMVVLEAMATGLPVIALRYGGPAQMVTPSTGRLINPGPEEEVVEDLGKALTELSNSAALRLQLGKAAKLRLNDAYLWKNKRQISKTLYWSALQNSTS